MSETEIIKRAMQILGRRSRDGMSAEKRRALASAAGKARAAKLSPARRSEIARIANAASIKARQKAAKKK